MIQYPLANETNPNAKEKEAEKKCADLLNPWGIGGTMPQKLIDPTTVS